MDEYSSLPRTAVELRVKAVSVPPGQECADERLTAVIEASNLRSQRVLQKAGFEHAMDYVEPDLRDTTQTANLTLFAFFPGKAARAP